MSMNEIASRVNALGSAWEQFKSVNDRRLNEIERKGGADPLTLDHLSKINTVISNYKERLDRVETAMSRPAGAGSIILPSGVDAEHKAAFCNYIRKGVEGDLPALEAKALSVKLDPADFAGLQFIKIVSNATESAERVLPLAARPL